MLKLLRIGEVEIRRELKHIQAYRLEMLADQILFTLGFLLLSGLFQLVADGNYQKEAQLASLIGYAIWRVADGCILRVTGGLSDDAQTGTLEQIWLSAVPPQQVLLARGFAVLLYQSGRGALLLLVLAIVLGLLPKFSPGAMLLFVLTQVGALGVAFAIAGLHLIYKNVSSLAMGISTALLFLTGALAPLESAPTLDRVSHLLPLTLGIKLLRQLVVEGLPFAVVYRQPDFYWFLLNTLCFGLLGWAIISWGQWVAQRDGSLAHY